MYSFYNVAAIGTLLLVIYILTDFFRNKTKNILSRLIMYTFIFYLLNVAQITTRGIVFPPQNDFTPGLQLVPFYFIGDWFNLYYSSGFDWFFWNSVKLSIYNVIMLIPLGIYLSWLFKVKRLSKAISVVFLASFTIETSQLVLGYLGFVMGRTFNVDDLILNTLGGVTGDLFTELVKRFVKGSVGERGKITGN